MSYPQQLLTNPDRAFILTLFLASLSAIAYFIFKDSAAGAGFLAAASSVGGIYAYSRRP